MNKYYTINRWIFLDINYSIILGFFFCVGPCLCGCCLTVPDPVHRSGTAQHSLSCCLHADCRKVTLGDRHKLWSVTDGGDIFVAIFTNRIDWSSTAQHGLSCCLYAEKWQTHVVTRRRAWDRISVLWPLHLTSFIAMDRKKCYWFHLPGTAQHVLCWQYDLHCCLHEKWQKLTPVTESGPVPNWLPEVTNHCNINKQTQLIQHSPTWATQHAEKWHWVTVEERISIS